MTSDMPGGSNTERAETAQRSLWTQRMEAGKNRRRRRLCVDFSPVVLVTRVRHSCGARSAADLASFVKQKFSSGAPPLASPAFSHSTHDLARRLTASYCPAADWPLPALFSLFHRGRQAGSRPRGQPSALRRLEPGRSLSPGRCRSSTSGPLHRRRRRCRSSLARRAHARLQ